MPPAYIDSSAVLKLAIRESETAALETYVSACDGLVSSRLAVLECRRAARRASRARVLQAVDDVLDAIYLIDITHAILDDAARADPPLLRSLDTVHLATALAIGDEPVEVITYDQRFADAARANGLTVVQPGLRVSDGARHPTAPSRLKPIAPAP